MIIMQRGGDKMQDFPIGSLVSQTIHKDEEQKRYGIVFDSRAHIGDRLVSVLWQLNIKAHAVSNKAYIEPVLISHSEKIGRPLEVVKRMPNVV